MFDRVRASTQNLCPEPSGCCLVERMNSNRRFVLPLPLALALAFLAGCAAPPEAMRDAWGAKVVQLKVGMSQDAVREIFGEPTEQRPGAEGDPITAVWLYQDRVRVNSTMKITGTEDRIYIDPITNQERRVPEPVYTQVNDYADVELRLEWTQDFLIRWRERRNVQSDFQ